MKQSRMRSPLSSAEGTSLTLCVESPLRSLAITMRSSVVELTRAKTRVHCTVAEPIAQGSWQKWRRIWMMIKESSCGWLNVQINAHFSHALYFFILRIPASIPARVCDCCVVVVRGFLMRSKLLPKFSPPCKPVEE